MLHKFLALACLVLAAQAACPNQCSGHGRCGDFDKCVCFRQQGLYSPYRYGFTGADCSLRTCPLGRAFDIISSSTPGLSPIVFKSSTGASNDKLSVIFIAAAQSDAYRALRRDQKFIVKIMTVTSGHTSPYGTFTWRYEEDEYYQQESDIEQFSSATKSFALTKSTADTTSGVYVYWDPTKGSTPDFKTTDSQIAPGDTYEFTLYFNEGDSFDGSDSNTAHQLIECSGRGTCDYDSGKCACLPGYTGENCQRTTCPNQCSGHGSCQTELRFASDGLASNSGVYNKAYDAEAQYGCKCDKGYRGPDCGQVECASGPDVLGAEGGADGMDCSGRGLCDYSTGICKCFKGFYGERCESQTTLV